MPPATARSGETSFDPPSKIFIVWIAIEKPRSYLYDRLWKNLNPGVALFSRTFDQAVGSGGAQKEKTALPPGQYIRRADDIDTVFYEASRAAKELQVACSITVVELGGPEGKSVRIGPI
jgi:hypothetical protein